MTQDDKQTPEIDALEGEAKARRDFLKKAGAAGVAAPAVAILLSAEAKAQIQPGYGPPTKPPPVTITRPPRPTTPRPPPPPTTTRRPPPPPTTTARPPD